MKQFIFIKLIIFGCYLNLTSQIKHQISNPTNRFLLRECFRRYSYCREGSQGSCSQGQVFVEMDLNYFPHPDEKGCSNTELTNCIESELSSDYSSLFVHSNYSGICVWDEDNNPCPGYPSNFVYLTDNKQCLHKSNALDFCEKTGKDLFHLDDISKTSGICDCGSKKPLYWPETDQCYRINSQGPCNEGCWLVLNSEEIPHCVEASCPADGFHVLYENPWNNTVGCYRLGTGEFCEENQVLQRVNDYPEIIQCRSNPVTNIAMAPIQTHKCKPGTKLYNSGNCVKIW